MFFIGKTVAKWALFPLQDKERAPAFSCLEGKVACEDGRPPCPDPVSLKSNPGFYFYCPVRKLGRGLYANFLWSWKLGWGSIHMILKIKIILPQLNSFQIAHIIQSCFFFFNFIFFPLKCFHSLIWNFIYSM